MSETIFHVAAGDKEFKVEMLPDGRLDFGIGQVGTPFMDSVFTLAPSVGAKLAAVLATQTFKFERGLRLQHIEVRHAGAAEIETKKTIYGDDSGDACHCPNCEHSMG